MVCAPADDKADSNEITVDALHGNSKTNNRGLVDVIVLKKRSIGPPLQQTADQTRVPWGLRLAVRCRGTPQEPHCVQCL
ncbi:MAG: hypothetical protein ACKPKO_05110, partial [Candidatus Fonsibacter sp.]